MIKEFGIGNEDEKDFRNEDEIVAECPICELQGADGQNAEFQKIDH